MKTFMAGALALSLIGAGAVAPQASAQVTHRTVTDHANGVRVVRKTTVRPNGTVRTVVRKKWGRGQRLPSAYRSRSYYVDYRRYRLSAPPRGHQWIRRDNQFLLVALTTGVIASVVAASN